MNWKEEVVDWTIGLLVSGVLLYFFFLDERVQRYMNCEDVPAYARTYERCF